MSFNSSSFYLPNPQHSVSRQAHPLLSHPTVSSHIPSSGGAWGGFYFVKFFPLRFPIYALLPYKTEAFADQSTVILQELLQSEKCVSKENIMLLILIFY